MTGDWNGDGTDDVFLYGPGNAPDRIRRSNPPAWLAPAALARLVVHRHDPDLDRGCCGRTPAMRKANR